jgi:hypothetical protein
MHRPNMKFTNKIAAYYFMIAQMILILLQLESPQSFARMREPQNLTKIVLVELCKAATVCLWTAYQCAQTLFMCLVWMQDAV